MRKTLIFIASAILFAAIIFSINILANIDGRKDVIYHYSNIDKDSFKLEAAKFLLENIPYHYSDNTIKEDTYWELWRTSADAILLELLSKYKYNAIPHDVIDSIRAVRDTALTKNLPTMKRLSNKIECDSNIITSDFLIQHIENAFNVWKTSAWAKGLSFEEFKEYILPYTSLQYYHSTNSGKQLKSIFSPMLCIDSAKNLVECVERYNITISNLRNLNGRNRRATPAGIYDMYVHGIHDCTDIAAWGCNILRACGIPVVVEHVIGYRDFVGKHFHCSIYDSDNNKWLPFNAESSLPGEFSFDSPKCLNIYRNLFSAQKETPYFLRKRNEPIPAELSNPCIKDVTSLYHKVYEITLPCDTIVDNKLAYLTTFNADSGTKAVTWGIVDTTTCCVTFKNVLPETLYMPMFYTDKGYLSFSRPFYIEVQNDITQIKEIKEIDNDTTTTTLCLTRKFPIKKKMKKVADELIGGRFLGSATPGFEDADILYTIKDAPEPELEEYKFRKEGKYKYYRFQASDAHPHANISHLEWISKKSYGYTNSEEVSRVHIHSPKEIKNTKGDSILVKILDSNRKRMTWAKEYDGNMQTAPGGYSNITLTLDEPQVVNAVRFAPLNADNGIKSGCSYELFWWDNGWKSCGNKVAEYEYIEFDNVPENKLYWLRNKTEGIEEMPFIIVNGKQKFVYDEIVTSE